MSLSGDLLQRNSILFGRRNVSINEILREYGLPMEAAVAHVEIIRTEGKIF